MKKIFAIFVVALLLAATLSSCFQPTNVIDGDLSNEETADENNIQLPNGDDTATTTASINEDSHETVNALSLDNVHVFTPQKEPDGDLYTSFILSALDKEITFSARQVIYTDTKLFVEDLTGDSYPDVAAVFVNGKGTGVYREEIHIFDGQTLKEYPVENMFQNLTKHISLQSDSEEYRIVTDKETYYINKAMTGVAPELIFDNIYIDSINSYNVSEGAVHYITECQCGPCEFCGQINATLRFDGEKFVYDSATYIEPNTDIK